jgi:release factor glutamine methyltransferase
MTGMRRRAKAALMQLYRPVALWTIARDRTSRVAGLKLHVPRGVFHPGLFFSTKVLAREIEALGVTGRRVLDVGCGSGALALVAARAGGEVTAIDVNPSAVEATRANAVRNGLRVEVLQSDLFAALDRRMFDVVVVNPPYFRRDPTTLAERAWHAGAGFEYFEGLFSGLGAHVAEGGVVLMVLGEDCELDAIAPIAAANGWSVELHRRQLVWLEEQRVVRLSRMTSGI